MTVFQFEEIGDDLARPPLAAARALFRSGVVVSSQGWLALTPDNRRTIVNLGAQPAIHPIAVQQCLVGEVKRHMKLMPISSEPDASAPPERLMSALGPQFRLTNEAWAKLSPLERYVLATLSTNTRLLARASKEILSHLRDLGSQAPWKGLLAACEVKLAPHVLALVRAPEFLDGRAMMLARATGVRAARRSNELFDLYADTTIGPVELDWGMDESGLGVIWQAHASTWDGAFYPSASLLAATAAAACLADMAARHGPVSIVAAGLIEDYWRVGRDNVDEGATVVFRGRPTAPSPEQIKLAAALPTNQTVVDVNPHAAETLRSAIPSTNPTPGMSVTSPSLHVAPADRGTLGAATLPSLAPSAPAHSPQPQNPQAPQAHMRSTHASAGLRESLTPALKGPQTPRVNVIDVPGPAPHAARPLAATPLGAAPFAQSPQSPLAAPPSDYSPPGAAKGNMALFIALGAALLVVALILTAFIVWRVTR